MIRAGCHIARHLLLLGLLIAGCSGPAGEPSSTATSRESHTAKPMNLVLVSLDTLRADRLGCYGCPMPISPFLDALSCRAVQAEDVLAQNPSTIRSHRAIFTGRYIYQHQPGPPAPEITLAGRLAAAGYATAAYTDGGLMHARYGNDPGFQVYNDEGGGFAPVIAGGLDWLDGRDGETPFFMFLHTYDIHYPYTPPEPFADMFLPGDDPPYHLGADHGQDYWNGLGLSRDEFIWISRRYDGGVRAADRDMMRLWMALRDRDRLDDTVVIVVSDHGESL
ncbi:MAG TPA: sulfatase-like hydrolase/transferase, partial [bacterium]|nr:sulfatase-like hydrolase/transferase [bacterium]